jgi:hypothetical protein
MTRHKSGFFEDVHEYDISSAYPYAMTKLGIPKGYKLVKNFAGENGIYYIRGKTTCKDYPIIFKPNFKPLIEEGYSWVSGYELKEAMDKGEFEGVILEGILVEFSSDPALATFVNTFYAEKNKAKQEGNKAREYMYKILLNSLYGKFIQTVYDAETDTFKTGGLWCPPLATLITGAVRARLHNMEHETRSIHSATDAVKTHNTIETSVGLGGLEDQCFGDCCIVRGKLYAHHDRKNDSFKIASHGLAINDPKKAWLQLLEGQTISKKRLVRVKSAQKRNLPLLSWIDIEIQILQEVPEMPKLFLKNLKKHLTMST